MENEKIILDTLKKGWIVYVPYTIMIDENDPQYQAIVELANNNAKNIKTVKVFENRSIILIKKDNKRLEKLLNLKKPQIKKLIAIFGMADNQVLADFSPAEDFIKKFIKFLEDGIEKEKENLSMYR